MFTTSLQIPVAVAAHDYQMVRRKIQAAFPPSDLSSPKGGREEWIWNLNHANLLRALADAQYNLKEYADAEKAVLQAEHFQRLLPERTMDRQRELVQGQILLAMIRARLDRRFEAQQAIAPALKFHRDLNSRDHDDLTQRIELAQALHASALAGATKPAVALKEVAALLDGLPPIMRQLKSTALLRGWIADELKQPA